VARLRPNVDLVSAQEQVADVAREMRDTYPALASTGDDFSIVPLQDDTVRAARPMLLALLAGVGLFLALASANVASLALARATARSRELAIRTAIGASRARIAQLLIVESAIITGLAAVLGYALGLLSVDLLWSLRPDGISRLESVHLDTTVLAFTAGVSVLAGILFGISPVTHLSTVQPSSSLKLGSSSATRRSRRTRKFVIVVEVAIGFVLLIGAALLMQTLTGLQRADVGFNPEGLLTFKVPLAERRFQTDAERALVASELEHALADLPGVMAVGAVSHLPFASWANWAGSAAPEGVPAQERDAFFVDHRSVSPGYLTAMGARLQSGRWFDDTDTEESEPVIVIDRTYARRLFPDGDATGKRLFATRYRYGNFENTWAVVIGVIEDIRDRSPMQPASGHVYWPFAQSARWELTYVMRTAGDPAERTIDARDAVAGLGRKLAASEFRVMTDYVEEAAAPTRFVALLGGIFAAVAFALAALGLYGVVTYATTQRAQELGVRIVMGAKTIDILKHVLREGLVLGEAGVATGIVAALILTRFLGSLLYGVSPTDPLTFITVAIVFLAITLIASLVPAVRATKVDPLDAIRSG
jgi:putative ABC transport system permease protein